MIVDSSVIVALVSQEEEAEVFAKAILAAGHPMMSAASYLETSIVIDSRRDAVLSRRLDALIEHLGLVIEPVTADQARIARQAYRDFGKGSGHKAQLNFGDCFAYALAIDKGRKLLFKGDDFVHTDVGRAI